ncbi:hypothetical protein ACEUZ9_005449 [Paracoccus litorisediminis]|uniref:cell division protein FtsL n=1 Tax=Paracoccus litorisediminis TaxID=2006130 RepID=UPI00372F3349
MRQSALLLNIPLGLMAMGLAIWAYSENYRTQAAFDEGRAIRRETADIEDLLRMQRAEWAYLNRPDRLRDIAEQNYGLLRLEPRRVDSIMSLEEIAKLPTPSPESEAVPTDPATDRAQLALASSRPLPNPRHR